MNGEHPATHPVTITPRLVERVWGRTDLGTWFGHRTGEDPLGEAWLTDISCGLDGGGTLGAWLDQDRPAILGDTADRDPVLAKLLFTAAPLSVQVHPTDAAARATGVAPTGKNECWHILEADPGAAVDAGFTAPVTPEHLRAAIADGTVMDLMARHPVHPGDTVPVPAGTVHAIGPGLVLLEVQDPAQVTYRLFDYGRPRELQLDEGLSVAALGPAEGAAWTRHAPPVLVEAPRFVLERHELRGPLPLRPDGRRYHALVALAPGLRLDGHPLQPGAATFIPAGGQPVTLDGTGPLAVIHPGPGPTPCLPGTEPRPAAP